MMDGESANAQDARLEKLWSTLDTKGNGQLDVNELRKGLHKMNHPLKDADSLLAVILDVVDTDKDGKIQYSEFTTFIKQTEKALWKLFNSIDHNGDGRLQRDELREALQRTGLRVPEARLDQFFNEVDSNNDGVITFDEWRDFLLFIPAAAPNLQEVFSYFSSTVRVNPEGDVQISDDLIDGLGITQRFLNLFFGSIIRIAKPQQRSHIYYKSEAVLADEFAQEEATKLPYLSPRVTVEVPPVEEPHTVWDTWDEWKEWLISYVHFSGYFVAGGVSGIVSRTATAPLDRLKVYLIAKTEVSDVLGEAKSGKPLTAVKRAWTPLVSAMKELWAVGGMRSLFAGNGLNVVKVMPESAIKFGSYEFAKRIFAKMEGHNDPRHIHSYSKFIAGGIGGMVSQFAVYPIDTLKFRMQCETVSGGQRGNKLIISTFMKMWRSNGIVAFYRGLPMGLIGIFPYAALDLGTFEYLKRAITIRKARRLGCSEDRAQPGSFATATIGGFSGALGASLVYPINLLRTRLQSQGTVLHPRTYNGVMDVTRQTIKGEGVRGLFKGLTPNLLKVVPAVSITYVVYENCKKAMDLH